MTIFNEWGYQMRMSGVDVFWSDALGYITPHQQERIMDSFTIQNSVNNNTTTFDKDDDSFGSCSWVFPHGGGTFPVREDTTYSFTIPDVKINIPETCPDCKGTKKYVGLIKVEPCARCNGQGTI